MAVTVIFVADYPDFIHRPPGWEDGRSTRLSRRTAMGKTGNKRRARKKKKANHGKRPNS
jgi:hypothetical protein